MIIEQPPRLLRWLYPQAIWRMDSRQRSVYLTFDDGPIPQATPFILDTLDQYGAKATFFVVGDNALKYPQLLDELQRRGHRVGNHTFHHIGGTSHAAQHYQDDVQMADSLLHTNLFRPPHGWMTPSQYKLLRKDYNIVMWDVLTRDYADTTADEVVDNVKRYVRNGSIITFHDSLKSIDKLRTALPAVLGWLRAQGYDFCVFD